jgi:O-glycosyl hydrolase
MKTTRLSIGGVGLALILAGCGASPGTTSGSGGSNGSGGDSSNGGSNGNGGSNSSGGSNGSGGSNSSGGSNGSGGGTSTGGATGNGGSNSSGGSNGSGGAKGGSNGSGGSSSSGGANGSGGATSSGGANGSGGTSMGGATGTGGATGSGGSAGGSSGAVTVQLGMTEQMIEGFGINDNWAAGSTPAALFQTTGTGALGLTILRTGMSDGGAFYNSGEASGDVATLKAGAGSDAKLIGSVWSPPTGCKTANTVNPSDTNGLDGGHLMVGASCATTWANTIASFAAANGFYAMSIGNEPDFNSCGTNDPCNGTYPTTLMTAAEMVSWVKTAKTAFMSKAPNVKIIAPEASEWLHQWSNVSAGPDVGGHESSDPLKCGCFPDKNTTSCASSCTTGYGGYDYAMAADSAAWGDFDILGVHEYDSQSAVAWPSDVNGGKPNKEVWETEMSGVKWWPQQGPSCDIANGVAVAGWIHSALTTGQAAAWLWWWYQASGTDDNEGLLLKSGSSASGCTGTDTKRHYTFGNFSKFVRPGYTRVDVTGSIPSGVQISAYSGSGTVVVVAINTTTSTVSVPITITGGTAPTSMTPNVTDSSNNLVAGTAVTVSGGSFTAMLGGPSVTTFVSK